MHVAAVPAVQQEILRTGEWASVKNKREVQEQMHTLSFHSPSDIDEFSEGAG
jgi:hypothetical protein